MTLDPTKFVAEMKIIFVFFADKSWIDFFLSKECT